MLINDDKVVGNVTQTNERKAKTKLQKILGKIVDEKIKKMCGAKSLEDTAYPFRKKQKISCNNVGRCIFINGTYWPKGRLR
ncbi:hypothetical protein [Bacillus tropicus]|uniref:hypothetical protein n=1 Tax=Bacillus tropicus TaxID=2026188 RepID=UPI0023AFA486|nr:hypothetical protein [Bacillus tropicus]MDE7552318.1 hypothetical protein [Bacillus tropicus]MDE7573793.1 hypothetical protein [Bacillus tropicus]